MTKGVSNAEKVVRLITESDFNDSCREDFKNLKFYFFLLRKLAGVIFFSLEYKQINI